MVEWLSDFTVFGFSNLVFARLAFASLEFTSLEFTSLASGLLMDRGCLPFQVQTGENIKYYFLL